MITVREMELWELQRIAESDRSEHVTIGYAYDDGALRTDRVDWRVPCWPMEGEGFSVGA